MMRIPVNLGYVNSKTDPDTIDEKALLNDIKSWADDFNKNQKCREKLKTHHGWLHGDINIIIHKESKTDKKKLDVADIIRIRITKEKDEKDGKIEVKQLQPDEKNLIIKESDYSCENPDKPGKSDGESLAQKVEASQSSFPKDGLLPKCRVDLHFRSLDVLKTFFTDPSETSKTISKGESTDSSSSEAIYMLLDGRMWLHGNMAFFSCFNYLLSVSSSASAPAKHDKPPIDYTADCNKHKKAGEPDRNMHKQRVEGRLKAEKSFGMLPDPYLAEYTLDDFERLKQFKSERIDTKKNMPEITAEQGKLLTEYFMLNGYETNEYGEFINPTLDMANAFGYLMKHKKPVLRENDLLAGTMTPNPICGSVTQPYTVGWAIWGELTSIAERTIEPYSITQETIDTLHNFVLPFWMNRNITQVWKKKFNYPDAAKVNDRLFFLNSWGLISLSPGSPNFNNVLQKGIDGIIKEIDDKLGSPDHKKQNDGKGQKNHEADKSLTSEEIDTLKAMKIECQGILTYTENLAAQVLKEHDVEKDPKRKGELEELHRVLKSVPKRPAKTLHEAVQSLWIMFIGIGLDSMDDNVALGRLDQILQPFFEADMREMKNDQERAAYVESAIELVGCLFLRITSHLIAAPLIATWQNSAGPGTASTVVGGVKRDGTDAVNEMTYIILKVAELLGMDDPDMDARYYPGINDPLYLRRVCEVNYITSGTPAIHGDNSVIESLVKRHITSDKPEGEKSWSLEDIRDWVPCGCVEPVIMGKHFAATGDIDSNLVVPLSLALNDGYEPVAQYQVGPQTGSVESFETFEQFFQALEKQYQCIYERVAIKGSHELVKVQQGVMPAPLYSVLLDGCIENAKGMTYGGAKYNSSGGGFIGLSDVIDSLLVIKKLVFDEKVYTFSQLKAGIDANFEGHHASMGKRIEKDVPKFGSGYEEGRVMAQRVTRLIAGFLQPKSNGRGGNYAAGYRTNNNHTVYGLVTGATPSGRQAYRPFPSGLTPSQCATDNLLNVLNDVAAIDPETCNNSYTLNVRLTFKKDLSYRHRIDYIANYVEAYCASGGMQVQFNMVDRATLLDAMENPEYYQDLIARVSGYTGFYTRMIPQLQAEIISRAEFEI